MGLYLDVEDYCFEGLLSVPQVLPSFLKPALRRVTVAISLEGLFRRTSRDSFPKLT